MLIKLKSLLIFLAPSIILGMVVGAYPGYKIYKYTWEDAGFCTSCHVHDYATYAWKSSVHGQTTTCHDCHHQPLRAYLIETYIMLTQRPKFPRDLHHTPYVESNLCEACHVSNPEQTSSITGPMGPQEVAKIPKVDKSYLHKVHIGATTDVALLNDLPIDKEQRENPRPPSYLPKDHIEDRKIVCADCHGGPTNRGHNFSAVDKSCLRCHEHVHQTNFVREYGCRSCHFQEFLTPVTNSIKEPKLKKPVEDK